MFRKCNPRSLKLLGLILTCSITCFHLVKSHSTDVESASPQTKESISSSTNVMDSITEVFLFENQPAFPLRNADAGDLSFQNWFLHSTAEQLMGKILQTIIAEECPSASSSVIDAGMNRGYFTLLAARLGYDVVSFELSQTCIDKALASVDELKSTSAVHIKQTGLTLKDGGFISVDNRCLGGRRIQDSEQTKIGEVPLLSLATALSQFHVDSQKQIALLKMDIEGSEYEVLRGFGIEAFTKFNIKHLMVEASSHLWEGDLSEAASFFERIASISSYVYCLDPNLDFEQCAFHETLDRHLGKVFEVTDFAQALNRTFEYDLNPCCGNFYFRNIRSRAL